MFHHCRSMSHDTRNGLSAWRNQTTHSPNRSSRKAAAHSSTAHLCHHANTSGQANPPAGLTLYSDSHRLPYSQTQDPQHSYYQCFHQASCHHQDSTPQEAVDSSYPQSHYPSEPHDESPAEASHSCPRMRTSQRSCHYHSQEQEQSNSTHQTP